MKDASPLYRDAASINTAELEHHTFDPRPDDSGSMNEFYYYVGRRLRDTREQRGLSRNEVADAVEDLHYQSVARHENGTVAMSLEYIFKYASALHVTPTFLLQDVDARMHEHAAHERLLDEGWVTRSEETYEIDLRRLFEVARKVGLEIKMGGPAAEPS